MTVHTDINGLTREQLIDAIKTERDRGKDIKDVDAAQAVDHVRGKGGRLLRRDGQGQPADGAGRAATAVPGSRARGGSARE